LPEIQLLTAQSGWHFRHNWSFISKDYSSS